MNVSSTTTFNSANTSASISDAAEQSNLNKARAKANLAQTAEAQALPQPAPSNPANLGSRIDTRA